MSLKRAFEILDEMIANGELDGTSPAFTSESYVAAKAAELARCGPRLEPRDIALFDLLQEECGEVIQERSKLRRSENRPGFRKLSDPNGPTTMQRFSGEIYDMLTLIGIAFERGHLSAEDFAEHRVAKLSKLLIHSPEIF